MAGDNLTLALMLGTNKLVRLSMETFSAKPNIFKKGCRLLKRLPGLNLKHEHRLDEHFSLFVTNISYEENIICRQC
jgi:hypothetical protein